MTNEEQDLDFTDYCEEYYLIEDWRDATLGEILESYKDSEPDELDEAKAVVKKYGSKTLMKDYLVKVFGKDHVEELIAED